MNLPRLVWIAVAMVALSTHVDAESQLWFDVSKLFPVRNDLSLGGDTGIRGMILNDFFLAYVRPTAAVEVHDRVSILGGVGLSYLFEDGPRDLIEIRPWGGVLARWPDFGQFGLRHYVRVEQRFLRIQNEVDLSVLRLRYRLGSVIPLPLGWRGRGIYVPVAVELFLNAAGDEIVRFINQSRFVAGVGYRMNDSWRIELNYTGIFIKIDATEGFQNPIHVFRIQIKG
jgi:hypothetical protein